VRLADVADPTLALREEHELPTRMVRRMSLAALHQGVLA
jgi:hypothetical protein